ncbi:MAG: RNA polymerase sigma factor [Bacteroidia bacterium]|nr:RNA polymerase sigma factor [Bacteroidia bacterium]
MDQDQKLAESLIGACRKGDLSAQRNLYAHYYRYAMGVALRFCSTREDAMEVVNDSFLKVFVKLQSKEKIKVFRPWFRRVLINTSIDNFRKQKNRFQTLEIAYAFSEKDSYTILDKLNEEEIIALIQKLSPAYRMVFNLYVIEGHSHKEIADKLGIEVSTSKGNLSKAKARLRILLSKIYPERIEHYG